MKNHETKPISYLVVVIIGIATLYSLRATISLVDKGRDATAIALVYGTCTTGLGYLAGVLSQTQKPLVYKDDDEDKDK